MKLLLVAIAALGAGLFSSTASAAPAEPFTIEAEAIVHVIDDGGPYDGQTVKYIHYTVERNRGSEDILTIRTVCDDGYEDWSGVSYLDAKHYDKWVPLYNADPVTCTGTLIDIGKDYLFGSGDDKVYGSVLVVVP